MMYKIRIPTVLLLFYTLMSKSTIAQHIPFAVIDDPDGFTQIRLTEKRRVVDRLINNQVFAVRGPVDDDGWQDWSWIDYPDYSMQGKYFTKFINKTKAGMMHKSHIKVLTELPQWANQHQPEHCILSCKDPLSRATIEIQYGPFLIEEHKYTRNSDGAIEKIDNQEPWGIDGYVYADMNEIKSITLKKGNQVYHFPKQTISNLLMPNTALSTFGLAEGTDGTLFLYMSNSDGAGAYDVVWTIKDGECKSQFLYRNF